MAGTDDVDGTRLPGRTPRRRRSGSRNGNGHGRAPDADRVPEAADDEIDAVNRLMGFLRDDEE